MRKITLVCAALFAAMAASAEVTFTVEKLWESSENLPAVAGARQGVGHDGKVLVQDKGSKTIWAFAKEGDAITRTEFVKNDNLDAVGIAIDNAGNLVVLNGWAGSNPSAAVIIKNADKTCKKITFTLPKAEGATVIGRTDYVFASGDLFSEEGGIIYMYPQNQKAIYGIKVINGEVTEVNPIGSGWNAGNTASTIIVDAYGNLIAQARSAEWQKWNVATSKLESVTFGGDIKKACVGGCALQLAGKDLVAYNVGTENYNSEWTLFNITDNVKVCAESLYIVDKAGAGSTAVANWLTAQKIDENTYYIYQYCPNKGVGIWKVTAKDVPTDTEETPIAAPQPKKIMHNGQVVIVRDNKMYNMMGVEIN